ncbi:MAG: DUF4199 domain-containing protein [Bacteroidetes bacterium]|nr:DUF4199 domain-containing protein [Bacteroidota bacterium]
MTNQVNGKWAHVAQYGIAAAMGGVAVGLVVYMLELNQFINYVSYVFYILFLILGLRGWAQKRGDLGMTYGNAFGYAMLVAVVVAVILSIWTVVFAKVIAPGYIAAQQEMQYEKLRQDGMPEAQLQMAQDMGKRFTTAPILLLMALVGNLFVFTLINLITAAFFTKKAASPVDPKHIPSNNPYSPFQSNGPPSGHA